MIKVLGHKIEPTRFPDDTTQVWKLPTELLNASTVHVDWRFESEAELLWIAQLKMLLSQAGSFSLHVPYLPYARQDKGISNNLTFALHSFAKLLNNIGFDYVTAVDVHNPAVTKGLIHNFKNITVDGIHERLVSTLQPDFIVFPDAGARERYFYVRGKPYVVFEKERNQATGEITGHRLVPDQSSTEDLDGKKLLIVDDICDGGATFLSIARAVAARYKSCSLELFVTHGIFSKGRGLLEKAGFKLHTTNSLPRNPEGIPV
jgi:ribose-phosphate pyrophosphokinase